MTWYSWLSFAMPGYASPCFASLWLRFYLLCSALFSFAMPCHARVRFAMNGYASIGYMLCRCCSRLYKNSGTHNSGAIFVEPESCLPLISRAGILYTCSLLEKHPDFDPDRKFLEKNACWGPFCVGGHSRAPKVKNYMKNIRENHCKKSRDMFSRDL